MDQVRFLKNIRILSKKLVRFILIGPNFIFLKKIIIIFALKKVFPNLIKALKKLLTGFFSFNIEKIKIGSIELMGLITAIFFIKSFYRPKN